VSDHPIPLADAGALRSAARRTTAVQLVLAAATLTLVAGALWASGRAQSTPSIPVAPARASTVVVLDVSASISEDAYSRIGSTLATLARSGGPVGLVLFSDSAYEALPPGTNARELAPIARLFTVHPARLSGAAPVISVNPWTRSFTAGTRISTGLALALDVLGRDRVRGGRVLLVSDLEDDQQDVPALTRTALRYRQARVPIRVVAINASPTDQGFFARLLGNATSITPAAAPGQAPAAGERADIGGTGTLVLALLAVLVVLALNELWCAPLGDVRGVRR
jgi:hypothetical protein